MPQPIRQIHRMVPIPYSSLALSPFSLSRIILLINYCLYRRLLRDFKFVNIFLVGFIATFSLLVPPFFIPLYSHSLGLSSSAGAGLVAGFNVSSALGRFFSGYTADALGPLNTLFIVLSLNTISMFLVWPLSNSVGPLAIFVIVNGASNGGFFATIPTVVGTLFGSQRVSIAMSMIVTGWGGGYLLVRSTT